MGGRRSPKACKAASAMAPSAAAPKDTEWVGQLLQKTKWCKFFFEGKCQRGRHCTFAHSASELHAQPDLYRSQLCMEFAETGKCRYGEGCRFAHGEHQLRHVAAEAPGEELKRQLEEMRQHTKALEAQLEAVEGASEWHYDGAWAQGAWPCEGEYVDMAWEEAAWAGYVGGVFVPASPMQVAVFAPWTECDAASQPSTDCDGTGWEGSGSSQHGVDSDAEDTGSESAALRVVVRNTFIEFEAPKDAPARRRARSAPCGRAAD